MSLLTKIIIGVILVGSVSVATVAMVRHAPATLPEALTARTTTSAMTASTSAAEGVATTSTAKASVSTKLTIAQLALRTNGEWKKVLTPQQYAVLREDGTEIPYTSDLLHETRAGTFVTADCGEPVFRSEKKFDSGTGWPSFYEPIKGGVVIKTDTSYGMTREEVETPICHSHIGHLFHDAPQTPTGDRYCINGVALRFIPDAGQ